MAAFSSLKHFGDNFGNADIARQVAFFLNQRDKIAMSTSARGVREVVKHLLPTSTKYVTTVKPNFVSLFSLDNGVYSAPIGTFRADPDGFFDSFAESMIKHTGCNEDSDFYLAWYTHQLFGKREDYGYPRHTLCLEFPVLKSVDMALIVIRLRESVDRRLREHEIFPYTPLIMDAFEINTSIVDILMCNNESPACRCDFVESLSRRSTDIKSLQLVGEICHDAAQTIADRCLRGLKKLSITGDVAMPIDGHIVDILCEAVSEVGILESLDIGEVNAEYDGGGAGLIRVLDTCPLRSLSVSAVHFEEETWARMVRVLSNMEATEVKFTEYRIFSESMRPVFDGLFSNTSIRSLDLSFTKIGDEGMGALENMVERGSLIKLAIDGCSIGRDGIKGVLRATAHIGSRLRFISIGNRDMDRPDIFEGLIKTSLEAMHLKEVLDIATMESVEKLIVAKRESGRGGLEILDSLYEFQNLAID